jgi:hypothetical protein
MPAALAVFTAATRAWATIPMSRAVLISMKNDWKRVFPFGQ